MPVLPPEAFTKDETDRMLKHTGRHKLVIRTLLQSGLRSGEFTQIRYPDLSPRGITVRAQRAKNFESCTVPVSQGLLAELQRKRVGDARIFGFWYWLGRIVKTMARRSDIDPMSAHPHKFRSTFATRPVWICARCLIFSATPAYASRSGTWDCWKTASCRPRLIACGAIKRKRRREKFMAFFGAW